MPPLRAARADRRPRAPQMAQRVYGRGASHWPRVGRFLRQPQRAASWVETAPRRRAASLHLAVAFRSINSLLRKQEKRDSKGCQQQAYPFPVTLSFIADGLRRLRAVSAARRDANESVDVWRGLRNVESEVDFFAKGGTELAPMSGTTSLLVAVQYALGHAQGDTMHALLFKIVARSFIDRGANLSFLSCFPGEAEWCYPPLTFLSPTGRREAHTIAGIHFEIVEVEPRFSS